jgi:folylpolyglutamate synthase/dihydropteroate synthase
VATSGDKDVAGIVGPLAEMADVVHTTWNGTARGASPAAVAAAARAAGAAEVVEHPGLEEALAAARSGASDRDAILVTGSLYTVGAATILLRGG